MLEFFFSYNHPINGYNKSVLVLARNFEEAVKEIEWNKLYSCNFFIVANSSVDTLVKIDHPMTKGISDSDRDVWQWHIDQAYVEKRVIEIN